MSKLGGKPNYDWICSRDVLISWIHSWIPYSRKWNFGDHWRCHGEVNPYVKVQVEMERTEIMNVELSCVTPGCKRCPGDEIWKTKSLPFIEAFESMVFYCVWYHAPIRYSEQDEEELYYTLLAEFESLSSRKNQHKNEEVRSQRLLPWWLNKKSLSQALLNTSLCRNKAPILLLARVMEKPVPMMKIVRSQRLSRGRPAHYWHQIPI